jgi:enoyl-CoA hydratase
MNQLPEYEFFRFERVGDVLIVEFDRPEKLNALNAQMHDDIFKVLSDADEDEESRVLVLTGAGRAFCAGGDMAGKGEIDDRAEMRRNRRVTHFSQRLINFLLSLEKPIISMVNGYAIGLGASIALFCDMIVMADDAQIGDRHINIDVLPGDGGTVIWPLLIGPARAKEMLLTGRMLTGPQAFALGLVNRSVPSADLRSTTLELAAEVATHSEYSIRGTKFAINRHIRAAVENVMDVSNIMEMTSLGRPEHRASIDKLRGQIRSKNE